MAPPLIRAQRILSVQSSPLIGPRCYARTSQLTPRISRHPASTTSSPSSTTSTTDSLLLARAKAVLYGTAISASLYVLYLYATDTRASFHRWLIPPLLRLAFPDAEDAHHASTTTLKTLYTLNLHPREREREPSADLSVSIFGHRLANPIGISAGLDKDASIPDALFALGPAIVEVGGVTPRPQDGNPRPRVFRLPGLEGLVNRYGLNSPGADTVAARLRLRVRDFARRVGVSEREVLDGLAYARRSPGGSQQEEMVAIPPGSLHPGRLLLVQIAKNKDTDERDVDAVARDYVYCVNRLAPYADVLVVNVSSPNTPGLRDLQAVEPLTRILSAVVDEARKTDRRSKPRVMVKVSPDEDEDAQMEGIVQAVRMSGVDGVIVGNTTKRRHGLVPDGLQLSGREQRALLEQGGFSGPVMFDRTFDLVRRYRNMLDEQWLQPVDRPVTDEPGSPALPGADETVAGMITDALSAKEAEQKIIFATGGITNGQQALKILNAGASVAMVYTRLVYGGAGTVTSIKGELRENIGDKL